MSTLQQYINESSAGLSHCENWPSGMNIAMYHCGLIKFCNESNIQTVEQLISNVDIDEITDFPYWSFALDLTSHSKILTKAYKYIGPEFKSNIRCTPINWERMAAHWLEYLGSDLVSEQQALFALFALPAAQALDETHPVRIAWEKRLEEIWIDCKPTNMHIVREPNRHKYQHTTLAPVTYTPDSSKYDISTPYDHLSYYKQDEIDERIKRKRAAVYDYEDDQSTNTISYKQ
jgi:hypothetical protein